MSLRHFYGWSALVLSVVACGVTETRIAPLPVDPDARPSEQAQDDGGSPEAAAPRPPPELLDPSSYADLVTIDPAFPFGVVGRHDADDAIVGSRWGRHGGPMVTLGAYGSGGAPKIAAWSIPATSTAKATRKIRSFAVASELPNSFFYGADGMVDLPFGPVSLLSYSGSGASYAGEALLYSETYAAVTSRANANGFYSGVGVAAGARTLLVYSGLSPLSSEPSTTEDNGLYVAEICEGRLAMPAPCPQPYEAFGWDGQSGPVAVDLHGNVFVAASLADGATSDAIFALGRSQVAAGTAVDPTTLVEADSTGTGSIAAVAPGGAEEGWVLGIGFDPKAAVYARGYGDGDIVTGGTELVAEAIVRAKGVTGLSVFTDDDGDLWLAVVTETSGHFLELRRLPR